MDNDKGFCGSVESSPVVPPSLAPSLSTSSISHPRQRFTVELSPGETTIVSWKRLLRNAKKAKSSPSVVKPPPPVGCLLALEACVSPDERFHVDKSTTKQSAFLNKGNLEHRNEAHSSVNHKPRKRKGTAKGLKEKSEEYVSTKHGKLVNLGMKEAPVLRKSSCHSQIPAAIDRVGVTAIVSVERNNFDEQKTGSTQSMYRKEVKVESELSDTSHYKNPDEGASTHIENQTKRSVIESNEMGQLTYFQQREKNGRIELPDLNLPASKYLLQPMERGTEIGKSSPRREELELLLTRPISKQDMNMWQQQESERKPNRLSFNRGLEFHKSYPHN